MATKKILIQVILDDKATKKTKETEKAVQGLSSKVTILNKEQRQQIINDEKSAIQKKQLINSLKQQAAAEMAAAQATKDGRAQSGLNNAILLETGRLASDASYGFTAIANNLSQVVTLFASFVETNKGVVESFKQLGRSLLGIGGFLIAVQLLISFGPKLLRMFNDLIGRSTTLADVFKESAETVSELNGNFELYIRTLQDSTKTDEEKQIALKKLNEEFPDFIEQLNESGVSTENLKDKTKEAREQTDLYRQSIIDLAIARAAADKIEELAVEQLDILIKRREKLINLGLEDEKAAEKRLEAIYKETEGKKASELLGNRELILLAREAEAIENVLSFKDKKINKLDEEIDLLLDFTQISEDSNEKETKNADDTYDKLLKLLKSYSDKVLLNTAVTEQQRLKIKEEFALQEARALGASEEQLMIIRRYYAQERLKLDKKLRDQIFTNRRDFDLTGSIFQEEELTKEQKKLRKRAEFLLQVDKEARAEDITNFLENKAKELNAEQASLKVKKKLTNEERKIRNKALQDTARYLGQAASLFGEHTAANKTLRIAGAVMDTYAAADTALATAPVPLNFIQAAAVIAAGIANVKKIMEVKVPNDKGGARISAAVATAPTQAPDFNVVGAGGVSQLATGLADITGKPIQAFVVSKEISSAQELDRNITNNASLG